MVDSRCVGSYWWLAAVVGWAGHWAVGGGAASLGHYYCKGRGCELVWAENSLAVHSRQAENRCQMVVAAAAAAGLVGVEGAVGSTALPR